MRITPVRGVLWLTLLLGGVALAVQTLSAATLTGRLKGRILLQVESKGEAWYVYPVEAQRYFLGRPADAFSIMRRLGMGMSNSNLARLFGTLPAPTPDQGGTAFSTADSILARRFSGRIILQVEGKGEAYYIFPVDLKGYYLGRPADAFSIMRRLGLGISNADLTRIGVSAASVFQVAQSPPVSPALAACTSSAWICDGWSVCAPIGDQRRYCYLMNFDCANTDAVKPTEVQSCTPPSGASRSILTLIGCAYNNPPCATNAVCVQADNLCQPVYQNKLNALSLPGYQKMIDASGNLILTSGRYKVTLPDTKAEEYGKFRLHQLKVCSEAVEASIGRPPTTGTTVAEETRIEGSRQSSTCCGAAPDYAITHNFDSAMFDLLAFSDRAFWKQPTLDFNVCQEQFAPVRELLRTRWSAR